MKNKNGCPTDSLKSKEEMINERQQCQFANTSNVPHSSKHKKHKKSQKKLSRNSVKCTRVVKNWLCMDIRKSNTLPLRSSVPEEIRDFRIAGIQELFAIVPRVILH